MTLYYNIDYSITDSTYLQYIIIRTIYTDIIYIYIILYTSLQIYKYLGRKNIKTNINTI